MQPWCAPRVVSNLMSSTLGAEEGSPRRRKAASWVSPTGDPRSSFGRPPPGQERQYVDVVSEYRKLLFDRGLDVLVVLLAVGAAVGTATRSGQGTPTGTKLALETVAVTLMVLALL